MTQRTGHAAGESLTALLAGGDAEHPALIVPDSGEVLTYGQAADRVEALAQRLAGLGVRRGDRVALALPNGPDVVLLLLAVTALGAAAAPLNPAYTAAEYEFFLSRYRPAADVDPGHRRRSRHRRGGRDRDRPDRRAAGRGRAARAAGRRPGRHAPARVRAGAARRMSPSCCIPAGRRAAQAGPAASAQPHGLDPDDRRALPAQPGGCVVLRDAAVPRSRPGGVDVRGAGAGGAVVAPRRFTPQRFWPQAREHGATWLSAGPTLHQMILDKADDGGPPQTLRFVRSCSSALAPALLERAEEDYRAPMLEAYGMTEASHQMASNPLPPAASVPGSVGVPTGTEIGIVDAGRHARCRRAAPARS